MQRRSITKTKTKLHDIDIGCAVKALCFRNKKPWILVGLATGTIQIWNYDTNTLLKEYEGHSGPVQCVDFHISSPLFLSGGRDGKIKLWDFLDDFSDVTSIVVLEGHESSVNDVRFHLELPWIVSASDDHTVRLWSMKSCSCIAVLAKHSGAVTSCTFHPQKDLILSSSLDRTLCIWDIGGLRDDSMRHGFNFFSKLLKRRAGAARLKHVLEGHKSGVVHAIFHPTLSLIFSTSDDCSLYRWEKGKMRNSYHHQHVRLQTTGTSHPETSTNLNIFQRQNAEFFILGTGPWSFCSHPTKNLFALGYDNRMSIHRGIKEIPGFSVSKYNIYYVKDRSLRSYNFSCKKGGEDRVVLGPNDLDLPIPTLWPNVTTVSCNRSGGTALICLNSTTSKVVVSNVNDCNYNDKKSSSVLERGHRISAVLVAPLWFAVLTKSAGTTEKILSVRTLSNMIISEFVLPCDIHTLSSYSGLENLMICKGTDRVVMFDVRRLIVVSELSISSVYYIFCGSVGNKREGDVVVALVGDNFVTVANTKLERLCTVDESGTYPIESGAWDEENNGVFIYKTWKEIKYCLVNGESGTVMAYNEPLCIMRVSGNTIYGLDDNEEVRVIAVDASEYVIKSSIMNKDYMKQCCVGLC